MGFEPMTSSLPRKCSTTELQQRRKTVQPSAFSSAEAKANRLSLKAKRFPKAGEGNRTLVFSLEGCCTTIVLHPRVFDPTRVIRSGLASRHNGDTPRTQGHRLELCRKSAGNTSLQQSAVTPTGLGGPDLERLVKRPQRRQPMFSDAARADRSSPAGRVPSGGYRIRTCVG